MEKYKIMLPLVYLALAAVIAAGFHLLKVPNDVAMLIVGAALTRVKISK